MLAVVTDASLYFTMNFSNCCGSSLGWNPVSAGCIAFLLSDQRQSCNQVRSPRAVDLGLKVQMLTDADLEKIKRSALGIGAKSRPPLRTGAQPAPEPVGSEPRPQEAAERGQFQVMFSESEHR